MNKIITIKVINVEPGEAIETDNGYTRTSYFDLMLETASDFNSATEKREWFYNNWDEIKTKTSIFIEEFIKKYFDVPFDHIYVKKIRPIFKGTYDKDLSTINYEATVIELEKL